MYNDEIQCRFTFYGNSFQDVKSVNYKSFLYGNSDVRIVSNLEKNEAWVWDWKKVYLLNVHAPVSPCECACVRFQIFFWN